MFSQDCWSSRFTFNATVLAPRIHRSPRKMSYRCGPWAMQNDRERERETHNPEWVAYKMCSHCMLLLSWKHQSFYLLKLPENDLPAKLLKTLLLLEKLIYVRYLAALLLPFHWVLLSAHWGELSLCGSDEARSLSRSPCGLCISRRQTESWRYELCSQKIIAFSFVLFIFVSMFCLRVAMCERKRGRERNV